MRDSKKGGGFSLIEMLIGLALLGVILTVVTNLTITTMSYSTRVLGDADRLGELNTTSGYIGDNLRRALAVSTNNPSVNSGPCSWSPGTNVYPACIAILVPEARNIITTAPATNIDTYLILVYRVERRSQLSSDYKTGSSWADTNTYVIMEYRKIQCQVPALCDSSAEITKFTNATSISGMTGSVVMDSLTLDPGTGSTLFVPLAYTSTSKEFVLKLRTKRLERGNVLYTPKAGEQVLTVLRRN